MRIVLVGGGTGGHFYPLIAIVEAFEGREGGQPEFFYMGPKPYDAAMLEAHGIQFVSCPAGKIRRYRSILNIVSPFLILWGIFVALIKLFIIYPDTVMSKGGYTSVPVVIAAWLLRIPIVVHESDRGPGRANRLGGRLASYVAISYSETATHFPKKNIAQTGIPIRKALLAEVSKNEFAQLGIDISLPLVLVLGGSQGAERINNLILESLDELLPKYNVIHQTGESHFNTVTVTAETLIADEALRARYRPTPLMPAETLNVAYHAARIVVSRAGSTTIFENAVHAKPSILIPIPEDVSHDQRENAYTYARSGGAIVMEEGNLRDGLLAAEIARIIGDQGVYNEMAAAANAFAPKDAAGKLAGILEIIGERHAR